MNSTNNVIKSWREFLVYQDKTLKQGVEELNETLGTKVMVHHVIEFQNGTRSVRSDVYEYFVDEVFIYATIQMELKGPELQNLLTWKQMSSLPRRKR